METGSLLDVFLFLSSLLPFFGSRPGTNGIGMGIYHLLMEAEHSRSPDPPKGRHWAVPIRSGTYDFLRVRTQHECIMLSFLSFSLVRFMQPRRSAPKEGDNVTATCDCGRVTAILYSRLATRLGSLAIILPIHLFTINRVHICNHIPLITICMPIRPNAGVCASTTTHWWWH